MALKIIGKKINLRTLKISDAGSIFMYIKNRRVAKYLQIPDPYKLKDAHEFIRKSQKGMRKKESYNFGIASKDNNEIIGMISLMDLDWENKNAEIGYWLAREYQGQKIMPEAISLILNFGFKKIKLQRIYARVMNINIKSANLLEKFGFKFEGKLRKNNYRKGRWMDELRYSMLKNEFKHNIN